MWEEDEDFVPSGDLTPEQQKKAEEDAAFLVRLRALSNEELAKMLLNESLVHLVKLVKDGFATAADISAARGLLKDNNIGIVPTRTNAAGKLKQQLLRRAKAAERNQDGVGDLNQMDIDDFVERQEL